MHIFITGGTGYIGKAVVRDLIWEGHRVTALVRSSIGESRMRQAGARVEYGDLRQAAAYGRVAAEHDAILHLGMEAGPEGEPTDRAALTGLLDALRTSKRTVVLIYTSHVWVLGDTSGRVVDESAPVGVTPVMAWRAPHEKMVLEAASPTFATAVVRPGIVFGGRGGYIGRFFDSADREGAAIYVGTGENRWSLVHLQDLARLYRMILERRGRGIFHAVDGEAVTVRELAEAASSAAGCAAARSQPRELARKLMGDDADALCLDQRVRTSRSVAFGWRPQRPSFLRSAEAVYLEWRG